MPSCEHYTGALPGGLTQLGSGLVDAVNSSVKISGSGGQACYIEIKNNTVHLSPITVRYYTRTPDGERDLCSTSYQIGSFRTDVFKQTVFGDRISWNVEVALAADVDVAQLLIRVLATQP